MRPVLLLALLSASTGCSLLFQVDDEDRPSTAADVDAYFNRFYEAALQARMVCSGTNVDHARTLWLGPKASLLARAQALFATGHVRLKRDLGRACLAAIAAAERACDEIDATLLDPYGVCGQAFAGIVTDGADCASDSECRAGSFCDPGGGACPGHCTPYGRLNDPCSAADSPCDFDLACNCGWGTGPCTSPSCHGAWTPSGGGCGPGSAPCKPGLFCDALACAPLLGEGAECAPGACAPALRCDTVQIPPVCVLRKPATYACVPGDGECAPSAWCDDSNPADPRCRTFGGDGSPCGPTPSGEDRGCLDSECLGGTCVAIPAYGEPCAAEQRCAPLSTPATCNGESGLCGEVCG